MKVINIRNLNQQRLKIASKGYITKSELATYCSVGSNKAREIYYEIVSDLEQSGTKVSKLGLNPKSVNSYLGLSEKEIIKYAEAGL